MKLRIRGDSIRFRLGRSEVQTLLRVGILQEATHFPGPLRPALTYELRESDGTQLTCEFQDCRVVARVPREIIHSWATSEQVSIRGAQSLDADGTSQLKILLEKDFECLDGSSDECQDDAFAHPRRAQIS